ncbi:MAG: FadR family transcriptional regulator [Deltaproteobacteria bacterium]|nr:FadR family transcriptional regulator [Deltaproteobacteria bacterium]
MTFEKVTQNPFKKKSSFIADQILRMIQSGHYRAGSKLPSERAITEQMGVSRPSLREAISALQIVGILESRPGDGTYVSTPGPTEDLARRAFTVLEEYESPFENMQARKAMEIGVALLAIQVATDDDLAAIKKAWEEKCIRGRRGDLEDYQHYGKEFHLAIARATKNRIIEAIMDKLLDMIVQPLWLNMRRQHFLEDPARIEQMLDIHDRIVQAITRRDAPAAIRELEHHFDLQIEQIYEKSEENGQDKPNGK